MNIIRSDLFIPSVKDHITKLKLKIKHAKNKDVTYEKKQMEHLISYWINKKQDTTYVPFPLCEGGICDDSCTLKYKLMSREELFYY